MSKRTNQDSRRIRGALRRDVLRSAAICCVVSLVAGSAIVTKEARSRRTLSPLVGVVEEPQERAAGATPVGNPDISSGTATIRDPLIWEPWQETNNSIPVVAADTFQGALPTGVEEADLAGLDLSEVRWFNGRPIRPVRTLTMTVTGYSPDARSCQWSADGVTSSLHSVWTNGMHLVAADSRILPLGSIVTVPGYAAGKAVPVLDRGGAIKGKRLDLLFGTHDAALRWGRQRVEVTVWDYADGEGACDWRRVRDSRH